MKTLFKNYRLPENLDVLFLLVFGILLQMTDGSPFTMKERWMIVWETELPVEYFSLFMQKAIKTVLSIIVVIRCVTTYAYVVSAMLVIFCLLKNSAPRLMLLWLLIAGIKSILLTFVEALTGVYVCSAFGKIRKACIEFVISKALEITYLWGSVLNIFQEMERKAENPKKLEIWEHLFMQKRDLSCQRARSLLDESTLYKTACLNNFEFRDVPQIILQMLRRHDEMSSDSLLDPGMMLASVSNMGSFDNLKVSLSLGELGFIDLRSAQVLGLEDDETLSPQDKALKFLGLTWNDVKEIQRNRTTVGSDIYKIDKKTWKRVADGRTLMNKPKRGRGEVFIRELHRVELEDESRKPRKKSFDFKFSWSFFNLYAQKEVSPPEMDDDQFEEEEGAFEEENDDEEKEDEEPTPLFMSNIKEEVAVNRIHLNFVSKKRKGNAYAELYKQDFMSVIGPEVFDKASKLPQITFLKSARNCNETVMSVCLPTFEDPTQENQKEESFCSESEEKIYNISSLELDFCESEQTSAHFLEEGTNPAEKMELEIPTDEKKDAEEETISAKKNLSECEAMNTQSEKIFEESKAEFPSEKNRFKVNEKLENANSASAIVLCPKLIGFREQLPPCHRKRRIIIKRIGKPTAGIISPKNQSQNFLKNAGFCLNYQFESAFAQEKLENKNNLETPFAQPSFVGPNSDGNTFLASHNEQTHFLTELFQKPVFDALVTYDSKKKARVQKKAEMRFWEERADLSMLLGKFKLKGYDAMLHKRGSEKRQKKIWKSEVLKRASHRERSQVVKNLPTPAAATAALKMADGKNVFVKEYIKSCVSV